MNRRTFVVSAGAGLLGACGSNKQMNPSLSTPETRLAGMTLAGLRKRYREELFDVTLPFWDEHGVDQQHGGVMHGLDYDGTLVHSDKLLWFQGRAIWIYSFLYNHFGKDPRHLEIARKTRDFVLRHARQPDGWWAEMLARDGKVLQGIRGRHLRNVFRRGGPAGVCLGRRGRRIARIGARAGKTTASPHREPEGRFSPERPDRASALRASGWST